jgi:hypothetical protein
VGSRTHRETSGAETEGEIRLRVRQGLDHVVWYIMLKSGVHPTCDKALEFFFEREGSL